MTARAMEPSKYLLGDRELGDLIPLLTLSDRSSAWPTRAFLPNWGAPGGSVVITSRVAQIGHLRLQGGAGVCRRWDGLRGRGGWPPGQGYAGRTAAAALAGEAEPAAVSAPWARWSSMW